MSLDGGGWTLVWKNSFMDNLPLSDNMRYYSGYYKDCTSPVNGRWCNIPHKADKCTRQNGVQPAPAVDRIPGISLDKRTPYNYYSNCDTISGSLTSPSECRWHDCYLPSSISASQRGVQMTMAIFVR